jgi:hypothetical protein
VRAGGGVLWCFADSLVLSSNNVLEKGPPPLLGSTVGQAFISVKESVWGGILMGGGSARSRGKALVEGLFPGRWVPGDEV